MAIDLKKFVQRFVEEAREHLQQMAEGLGRLEAGQADAECINGLFRSAHTIKGSSRMLKLVAVSDLAHRLEDVLGALREGAIVGSSALARQLFAALDMLARQVDWLAEGGEPAALPAPEPALIEALARAAEGGGSEAPAVVSEPAAEPPAPIAPAAPQAAPEPRLKAAETVRVRLAKLDELIKLMGEVVSSHARLRQRLIDARALERTLAASGADAALLASLRSFAHALKDDVQGQESLMSELHDRMLLMRMLPLAIVFEPAQRLVRELARSIGKEVECVVRGAEIELDRQIIDKLSDPIIHLIRNAIDHGVEPAEQRLAAGKPRHGRLSLDARQDGAWVVIEVADDGAGIALEAVRDKAVRKGLFSAEAAAALSEREVLDLIFMPGFSTSSIITDLSGRGVGLDVVRQCVLDELRGLIEVDSRPGAGTRFILRLPLSLAVMRVLLVEAGGQAFAFTAQHVAEILRLPADSAQSMVERQMVYLQDGYVPVLALSELVELPARSVSPVARRKPAQQDHLLVLLQVRDERMALRVDELLDERDMVIKPLPPHMQGVSMVSGMVTTGDNELVGVLHAPALFERARRSRQAAPVASPAQTQRQPHVLVVDDSLNTREIERDVLEAHGYRVTLAEDGLDGLEKARAGRFDAVLTDVDMPRMNGFELVQALRADEYYRHCPLLILTAREKEEDKRRGMEVGADAYIVKGEFDRSNLVETLYALLGWRELQEETR